jgi:hypothetical protein
MVIVVTVLDPTTSKESKDQERSPCSNLSLKSVLLFFNVSVLS